MSEPVEADKLFDPNGPDPATSRPAPVPAGPQMTGTGRVLRLAVGGASLALNAIQSATRPPQESTGPAAPQEQPEPEQVDPALRQIFVGAVFEAGDRVDRQLSSAAGRARKLALPPTQWARQSRLTSPVRGIYNKLASRSSARLERWQERGAAEELQGRALLGTVVDQSVDTTIDFVVDSPQVQGLMDELVTAESLALSQRVFVELRGRGISADLYDAHLVHSVLRHPSPEIPPPPRRIAFSGDAVPPPHLRGRTAGFVTRLTALITDIVIVSILVRAAGWLLDDVRLATGLQIYVPQLTDAVGTATPVHLTALGGLLISVSYLLFFWTMGGQTPGKALLGLRVVTRDGGRLSFWRSLVRFFGYWLSSLLFGAGFLWASVDNYREGLHDKLAGTSVVYAWDARPDNDFLTGRIQYTDEP